MGMTTLSLFTQPNVIFNTFYFNKMEEQMFC